MSELGKLYSETIRAHNATPFHFEIKKDASLVLRAYNPICGDRFDLYLDINGHDIHNVFFHGFGCAISKASASVLAKSLAGKSFEEALQQCNNFLASMEGKSPEGLALPEEWKAFLGVVDYPERRECATLAWIEMKKYLQSKRG